MSTYHEQRVNNVFNDRRLPQNPIVSQQAQVQQRQQARQDNTAAKRNTTMNSMIRPRP